jgi:hypothetical protein
METPPEISEEPEEERSAFSSRTALFADFDMTLAYITPIARRHGEKLPRKPESL